MPSGTKPDDIAPTGDDHAYAFCLCTLMTINVAGSVSYLTEALIDIPARLQPEANLLSMLPVLAVAAWRRRPLYRACLALAYKARRVRARRHLADYGAPDRAPRANP